MVMEAKMNAIDVFVEYMREKIEIDDEFMEFVKEFKNSVNEDTVELSKAKKKGGESGDKEKMVVERKRPPTAYHIFMSETSARLREEKPSRTKKEVQDEAKRLWKEKKESEPAPPKAKKGKKNESSEASTSASASEDSKKSKDSKATVSDADDSDCNSDSEDVVQRIKAAVEAKTKTIKAKKGKKAIVADLVDELTSDE